MPSKLGASVPLPPRTNLVRSTRAPGPRLPRSMGCPRESEVSLAAVPRLCPKAEAGRGSRGAKAPDAGFKGLRWSPLIDGDGGERSLPDRGAGRETRNVARCAQP